MLNKARTPPQIGRVAASRHAWGGWCLCRFHEAGISPTLGHARGPVPVSVWPSSWAALRGAALQGRPFGELRKHLPGRSRAHVPFAAPCAPRSTHAHEGPPSGLPFAARWGASRAAIGCTGGRPLGCGHALVLRSRVLLVTRLVDRRRRHVNMPSAGGPYSPALSSQRAPARIPLPLSHSRPCRRRDTPAAAPPPPPPPLLPLSSSRPCLRRGTPAAVPPTPPATVELFPPLPPAWHAGCCSPPSPPLFSAAADLPRVGLCPRTPPVLCGRRRGAVCATFPRPLRPSAPP